MRSIAVINQKGGVGKTTTAVNVSAALAELGRRVCLLDLDPQAHASLHLGVALSDSDPSIYDVLTGDTRISDVRRMISNNLHVVPASLDLAAAEMELAGEPGRETILRDKLVADLRMPGSPKYDFLIIDCPPSLGVLTLNALTAVQEVMLPLQPHFLALHGLSKLLKTIEVVAARFNPDLRLSGVVLCMYESGTRLAAEVCADVREYFERQSSTSCPWSDARDFETRIRRNIRLAEAPSFGQSIFQYAPHSHGAEDYRSLAKEVLDLAVVERTKAAAA